MKAQTLEQIDEKLNILRESWADARAEKKASWMTKINEALDERNALLSAATGERSC